MPRHGRAWLGAAALLQLPAAASALCQGQLDVAGVGTVYATGQGAQPSGSSLTMDHNNQVSLTNACLENWDPSSFTELKLIGQTISFTVDLSGVGCACNLAFYLVQSPAKDASGAPSAGQCPDSPYYCDANQVCGQYCTELDIMEANSHTFAATPHRCDASPTPQITSCDRGGIGRNAKDMGPTAYGPGAQYTIDTTKPFEVHTSFMGNPTVPTLTGMSTVLLQETRRLEMPSSAPPDYLGSMAAAMGQGMSLRITYWGKQPETMNWLDDSVCGEEVCEAANARTAHIRDIKTYPLQQPPPQPGAPAPGAPPEGRSKRAWAMVLLGLAFLALACSAQQSREQLEDLVRQLPRGLGPDAVAGLYAWLPSLSPEGQAEEGRSRGPAGATAAETLRGHLEGAWAKTREYAGIALEHMVDFTVAATGRAKKYWSYGRDIVRHLSLQRASSRLSLQEAVETASAQNGLRGHLLFEVGESICLTEDIDVGGRRFLRGTLGVVQSLSLKEQGASAAVLFEREPRPVSLTAEHLRYKVAYAPEEVERQRRDAKITLAVGALALLVLVLLWATKGFGADAPAPPPGPYIPPGGCCSWDHAHCGATTDWCKHPDHCNPACKGEWLMPVR